MNTLLPAANITLFSSDSKTGETLTKLSEDWRFARIKIAAQNGDVAAAIEHYQQKKSPDLLILQTKDIGEIFIEKLEKLAGLCGQNTECIIIGPVNDVPLYRNLTQMGIRDYLVAPVSNDDFVQTISQILLDKYGQQDSQLISVLGARGGTGATTIAQLIAEGLTQKANQKTLLMDTVGAWGNLPVWLGFEPTVSDKELAIAAKSKDQDSMQRMIIMINDKLSVAATGAQNLLDPAITAEEFDNILDILLPQYPYLVIDLSGAPETIRNLVVQRSSRVLLVSEPSISGLRICKSLLKELKALRGGNDIDLIMNKRGQNDESEVSGSDTKAALERDPLWTLGWLPKVMASRDMQDKRFADLEEGQTLMQDLLHKLYEDLVAEPEEKKGLLAKLGLA